MTKTTDCRSEINFVVFFFSRLLFAECYFPGAYLSLRRRYNWADCNSRRTETRS